MPRRLARPALVALGLAEIVLAGWVISGRGARRAAVAETGLLALMNGGGFAFSRRHIPKPKMLLAENLAFLAVAWWAALSEK